MHIEANRQAGQLLFDLMRGRLGEAGFDFPAQRVGMLSDFWEATRKEITIAGKQIIGKDRLDTDQPPDWLITALKWHPRATLFAQTFQMMSWLSLIPPDDERRIHFPLEYFNDTFEDRKYRLITPEEDASLTAELTRLVRLRQHAGALGAAGNAFYATINEILRPISPGAGQKATQRRKSFKRETSKLCLQIEAEQTLADCKATASMLGEKLAAELRSSAKCDREREMRTFWGLFDRFFESMRVAR